MRLGEIKQKLDKVVGEDKTIQLPNGSEYNGQAQRVSNYSGVMDVLEYIATLKWSGVLPAEVLPILEKYPFV